MLLSIVLVLMVTFLVFPGVVFMAQLEFTKSWGKDNFSWFIIFMLLLFNVGDTVGKKLGGIFHIPRKMVVFFSFARIIQFFTTYVIAYNATSKDSTILSFLNNDIFIVINMIIFAVSNGYLIT